MSIYLIAHDGGYEGHTPLQAFLHLEEAKAALALMKSNGSFDLFEVPVWPETATEWFRIEPMNDAELGLKP